MRRVVVISTLLSGCAASSLVHPQAVFLSPSRTKSSSPIYSVVRGGASPPRTQLHLTALDNGPFHRYNQVLLAANLLGFVISVLSGGSHIHLDLLGTGAFALAAIPSGWESPIPRVRLSAGCVSLWATKLASFLFVRALHLKHDPRLEDTLATLPGTATFWVLSLAWGVICSLPHSLGVASRQNGPLLQSPCSLVGAGLFCVGFLTETVADLQKWRFKRANPGAFCDVGLWSISQHPNFCGNLMLWSGLWLLNAPALIDPPPPISTAPLGLCMSVWQTLARFQRLALAALSPLFLYTLFHGQASGSFSNSQALAQKKYGQDPAFVQYTKTVPLLFPNPLQLLAGTK